jgi:hypothetical protein
MNRDNGDASRPGAAERPVQVPDANAPPAAAERGDRKAGLPGLVRCGRAVCGDLAQAERREGWLANGLGAYAAGTLAGSLTRRYHGLLIAPLEPPSAGAWCSPRPTRP